MGVVCNVTIIAIVVIVASATVIATVTVDSSSVEHCFYLLFFRAVDWPKVLITLLLILSLFISLVSMLLMVITHNPGCASAILGRGCACTSSPAVPAPDSAGPCQPELPGRAGANLCKGPQARSLRLHRSVALRRKLPHCEREGAVQSQASRPRKRGRVRKPHKRELPGGASAHLTRGPRKRERSACASASL